MNAGSKVQLWLNDVLQRELKRLKLAQAVDQLGTRINQPASHLCHTRTPPIRAAFSDGQKIVTSGRGRLHDGPKLGEEGGREANINIAPYLPAYP